MIAVVTGASGFIGRNLVGRLQREGHVVRSMVRRTGAESSPSPGTVVDWSDPAALRRSAVLEGADVVFHLAAATRARSAAAFREANVATTRRLLEALVSSSARARVVFVSSQAAAGPAPSMDRPIDETDPARPVEEYGRSKLEAEGVVREFSDRLSTVILRPCSVFGPFDRDFLRLFRMAQRGVLLYPGVGAHWLSLLHVDDVVEGLLAAARSSRGGPSYFLAPSSPIQWMALGSEIEAVVGRSVLHVNVPGALVRAAAHMLDVVAAGARETPLLNGHKAELSRHPYWVCTAALAEQELGWRARRSLPDALRETYLWYQQAGWLRGASRAA